jgi:beta-lactamase regulating signal transducer with metallopeptidase domain
MFPDAVYTLWLVTVVLALVLFVPIVVYSLYRLLRTARSIQTYASEGIAPAQAIAAHTAALPALDNTIAVATEILAAAEGVAQKLDTIATVLEARASQLG